eukprot:728270-Prorocentrum_minimum.AAC.1
MGQACLMRLGSVCQSSLPNLLYICHIWQPGPSARVPGGLRASVPVTPALRARHSGCLDTHSRYRA